MNNVLTFIIPIRHHESASNWSETVLNLKQTMVSIAAQSDRSWKCIIVANEGAALPDIPEQFEVCRVDFPPNVLHIQGGQSQNDFWDAVRLDKGRRVLSGLLYAKNLNYFMVVDDDDFIHRDLVKFTRKNNGENGWYIDKGYVWGDGGKLLMDYSDFYLYCGTSHIVKTNLLELPEKLEDVNVNYMKDIFGSHIKIKVMLESKGVALSPLPFHGAIYRIGHRDAHSKSNGMYHKFFCQKYLLKQPKEFIRRLLSLRYINRSIRFKFFGRK